MYELDPIEQMIMSSDVEVYAKYLFLLISRLSEDGVKLSIHVKDLSACSGLAAQKIYRARKILINYNALKLTFDFCSQTGKKLIDNYELIF